MSNENNSNTIETGDALTAVATAAEKGAVAVVGAEEEKKVEQKSPQDDKFASRFAALSRKEKQLRERERQMEQRMQELENKYKSEEEQVSKYKSIPDRLKKEPLKVLEEYGLTPQQLAEMMLNDGKPTFEMMLSDKEKAFKSELDEIRKKLEEKEQKEQEDNYNQILTNFKKEIAGFVNDNKNEYELIVANDAVDLVYEVIEQHHADTKEESGEGEILDTKKACEYVEQYLLEEAKRHLSLNKVKGLLPKDEKPDEDQREPSRTLSNTDASKVPNKKERFLSDEESKAEAAKLIRWID